MAAEDVSGALGDHAVPDGWADVPSPSYAALGLRDLVEGARRWPLWTRMAWEDLRQRYRRSVLGPFWFSLTMLIMILCLGVLYAQIFHREIREYLPFLSYGLLFWQLMSDIVRDGCVSFTLYEGIIRQVRLPLSTHVYRLICRHFLVFAHNLIVCVPVAMFVGGWPGAVALWAIPALLVWAVNAVWIGLLLGTASARYRDIPPLVSSALQMLFFISPIMWEPASLGPRAAFVVFSPVYHFIEIVRAPLLGHVPSTESYAVVGAITLLGWAVTFPFYARFRNRITYWL